MPSVRFVDTTLSLVLAAEEFNEQLEKRRLRQETPAVKPRYEYAPTFDSDSDSDGNIDDVYYPQNSGSDSNDSEILFTRRPIRSHSTMRRIKPMSLLTVGLKRYRQTAGPSLDTFQQQPSATSETAAAVESEAEVGPDDDNPSGTQPEQVADSHIDNAKGRPARCSKLLSALKRALLAKPTTTTTKFLKVTFSKWSSKSIRRLLPAERLTPARTTPQPMPTADQDHSGRFSSTATTIITAGATNSNTTITTTTTTGATTTNGSSSYTTVSTITSTRGGSGSDTGSSSGNGTGTGTGGRGTQPISIPAPAVFRLDNPNHERMLKQKEHARRERELGGVPLAAARANEAAQLAAAGPMYRRHDPAFHRPYHQQQRQEYDIFECF